MAEENKNTGPSLQGNTNAAREQIEATREARREQGDYLDLLKQSESVLKRIVTSYDSIEGRIESLSKGSINVKEINKLLEKSLQDELILRKKIETAQKEMQENSSKGYDRYKSQQKDIAEIEKQLIEAKQEGDINKIKYLEGIIDLRKQDLDVLFKSLNVQEQTYETNLKALDLAEQQTEYARKKLEIEKQLEKSVGDSGKLMGKLAQSLGLGNESFEEMVEYARKVGRELTFSEKLGFFTKTFWEKFKNSAKDPFTYILLAVNGFKAAVSAIGGAIGSGGPISKFTSQMTGLIKQIPIVGGLLGGIVEIGVNLLDMLIGTNSETQKFGRNLGMSYEEAKKVTDQFVRMSIYSGNSYLNVEKLRESQNELSKGLGLNSMFSEEMLKANIQLKEQAGLELDVREQLAAATQISGKVQTDIYKTLIGQTEAIRRTLGVNIRVQDSIKEVTKLSGVLGLTFSKYPEKLTQSLLIVKSLGMDLQKVDSIASGLLNYEESIAKEFEAQLITGKDINLNRAREFALANDMAGVASEISKQFKSSSEFVNSNRIAQEAWSAATGMTRDEVADMLRKQELYSKVGAKTEEQFRESIRLMKERGTLQSEFIDKLSEEQAMHFLNSTATETIANFFDKIKQSFANMLDTPAFKRFLDSFMNTLNDPNFVENIVNKLTSFAQVLAKIAGLIVQSVGYVVNAADYLTFGSIIPNEVPENLIKIGEGISSISVGNTAIRSSAGNNMNSSRSSGNSGQSGPTELQANINVTVDDNERKNSARIRMAAKSGYNTGPYGES